MNKGLEEFNYIFDTIPMPDVDKETKHKIYCAMDGLEKKLKVLEIIKYKPQYELYLIQLGKIKTYDEYLKSTSDWELEYWDLIYTEEEFNSIREVFKF